jgi:hypothetical protein
MGLSGVLEVRVNFILARSFQLSASAGKVYFSEHAAKTYRTKKMEGV